MDILTYLFLSVYHKSAKGCAHTFGVDACSKPAACKNPFKIAFGCAAFVPGAFGPHTD